MMLNVVCNLTWLKNLNSHYASSAITEEIYNSLFLLFVVCARLGLGLGSRTRTWRLVRDSDLDSRVGDSDLDSRVRDSDLDSGFRDSTTSLH
jgi:hypothetical protein